MTSDDKSPSKPPAASGFTRHGVTLPPGVTTARLGMGRAGSGMPTKAVLEFALDHARARDAVRTPLDFDTLERDLVVVGLDTLRVESAASDREIYLRRPDFGRRLSPRSRSVLGARPRLSPDVVVIVGDGLSSTAVQTGAVPLLVGLVPRLRAMGLTLGPLVLAGQARVALADEVGQILDARLTLMCIGERPGLSASDSLGVYLTLSPRLGRTDADRNCVSNIRAGGLEPEMATSKLTWLVNEAIATGVSGVQLKDESDVGSPRIARQRPSTDAGHLLGPSHDDRDGP